MEEKIKIFHIFEVMNIKRLTLHTVYVLAEVQRCKKNIDCD